MKLPPSASATGPPEAPSRLNQFAGNAVWSVLGIAVGIAAAVLMSPYLIRKLGTTGYGVWSLVFAISNYYTLLDFGVRSAVINFTAQQVALRNQDKLNEILSTAMAYAVTITALSMATILYLTPRSASIFGIGEEYSDLFPLLFFIVCTSVALSFSSSIVSGCLEGFQQYGVLRRIQTIVLACRTLGYLLILWQGGGLLELVVCTFLSWLVLWGFFWIRLRRVFPEFHLQWSLVRGSTLLEIGRYGVHTTVFSLSMLLLEQTPPVLIARSLPDAAVGYYSLPLRMTQIPLNMIRSVTEMMSPLSAEFTAQRKYEALAKVTVLANRYSFILYAPLALLGMAWGIDVMRLWVGEEYALNAGPLLLYFLLGTWIAQAGQSASIGVLFGMGKHRWCAWGMLAEGLAVVTACYFFIEQSMVIVAMWACAAVLLNRGLVSAWAVCQNLNIRLLPYLWSIYGIPSLIALPVFGVLLWIPQIFPVTNWWTVFVGASLGSMAYLLPAFLLCVEPSHQEAARGWMKRMLRLA